MVLFTDKSRPVIVKLKSTLLIKNWRSLVWGQCFHLVADEAQIFLYTRLLIFKAALVYFRARRSWRTSTRWSTTRSKSTGSSTRRPNSSFLPPSFVSLDSFGSFLLILNVLIYPILFFIQIPRCFVELCYLPYFVCPDEFLKSFGFAICDYYFLKINAFNGAFWYPNWGAAN